MLQALLIGAKISAGQSACSQKLVTKSLRTLQECCVERWKTEGWCSTISGPYYTTASWVCWRTEVFILQREADGCIIVYMFLKCSPRSTLRPNSQLVPVILIWQVSIFFLPTALECLCIAERTKPALWTVIHWFMDIAWLPVRSLWRMSRKWLYIWRGILPVTCPGALGKEVFRNLVQTSFREFWAF